MSQDHAPTASMPSVAVPGAAFQLHNTTQPVMFLHMLAAIRLVFFASENSSLCSEDIYESFDTCLRVCTVFGLSFPLI
jgi:hypothetical protein